MIIRKELDELYEWARTTKFPLYKLNNPEHYSNKRIDYSWNKLVDHKNKSTIRKKFMTERIVEIHHIMVCYRCILRRYKSIKT